MPGSPSRWVPSDTLDARGIEREVLAVVLNRQLLQIRGKARQVLLVTQHRDRLRAEEIALPDHEQPRQNRQIALERCGPEMLIHCVKAGQWSRFTNTASLPRGRA